jgi:hypothetical protein
MLKRLLGSKNEAVMIGDLCDMYFLIYRVTVVGLPDELPTSTLSVQIRLDFLGYKDGDKNLL